MNTRNVNIKTAASESTKTSVKDEKITDEQLVQLYDYCELYGESVRHDDVESQVNERYSFCIDDVDQEVWLTDTLIVAVDCETFNMSAISLPEGKPS